MKFKIGFIVDGSKEIEATDAADAERKFHKWYATVTPRTKSRYMFWHAVTDTPLEIKVRAPRPCGVCGAVTYIPADSPRVDYLCTKCAHRFRTVTGMLVFLLWISGRMPKNLCQDCDDYQPIGSHLGFCWRPAIKTPKYARCGCEHFKKLSSTAIRKIVGEGSVAD